MPPATRQRAAAQPFTSPSADFTPLSLIDVETMLQAAEQSTESAPAVRRSTRRTTLLSKAKLLLQQQGQPAVEHPPAKSAAGVARRSTAVASALPPKTSMANRSRLTSTTSANSTSTQRPKPSTDKENVGPAELLSVSKLTVTAKPLDTETRRSSRLSSIPAMTAAPPAALGRIRQPRKPSQIGASKASVDPSVAVPVTVAEDNTARSKLAIADTHADFNAVVSPAKTVPALPTCHMAASQPAVLVLLPSPAPVAIFPPTADTAVQQPISTTSSVPTTRNARVRPIPIQAIQLLSPVRAAPLSARARTHSRAVPIQRRRSASVRRESLLGDAASMVWQVNTPPSEEVRQIVQREEEKRRSRAEKEKQRRQAEQQRVAEEAEKERQRIADLQEAAVVETRRRLRMSSPHFSRVFNQPRAVTSTSAQLSVEQHSVVDVVPQQVTVAGEQRLQVDDVEAEEEVDSQQYEQRTSGCSLRALMSASLSAALLAAIGAVLCCPSEVHMWLS